jgi:hypothetical protein
MEGGTTKVVPFHNPVRGRGRPSDFAQAGHTKAKPTSKASDKSVRPTRENITHWTLEQFRSHYGEPSTTKWDIFHYVYAVLHHPEYRRRYAANLRRELPRIPFVTTTLSSRARQDGSLANNPAESRDLVPDGDDHRPKEELSAQSARDEVGGRNSLTRPGEAHGNTRSFDSESGLASKPTLSAQDDRAVLTQDDRVGVNAQDDGRPAPSRVPPALHRQSPPRTAPHVVCLAPQRL